MMGQRKLTVGLLSHYFRDSNLGCTALSICNLMLVDKAIKTLGWDAKYVILENEKQPQIPIDFMDIEYEYRVFPSTKQTIRHPVKFLKSKAVDDCDIVFNICAGDGFTDIYGTWRTYSESYMTLLSALKGHPTVLAPQTIGPFNNIISKSISKFAMDKCLAIFARDHLSYQLCEKMGQKEKTTEVIDVALALPYQKKTLPEGFNVGINVSGLLYDLKDNRFGLSINYDQFINDIVKECIDRKYNVHLISHVNIETEDGEDDYAACKKVHQLFPETILVPRFYSPIDAKGYISGLDLFTGARMHATIASISSGVPVIPIAYSRKVNGLYGNLKYPYYIDAKGDNLNNQKALDLFLKYLNNIQDLNSNLIISKGIADRELEKYTDSIVKLLEAL